jgi:hypothetical protein
MDETLEIIHTRIRLLDGGPIPADSVIRVDPDIVTFVRVMSDITPPGSPRDFPPAIDPAGVDELLARCELLARLREKWPALASGPIGSASQYWIAARRPTNSPPRVEPLSQRAFVPPLRASPATLRTKPFYLGLFSSSGIETTPGMWWCYLKLHTGSSLFPRPWRAWSFRARPEARVAEVRSAADWVALIASFPMNHNGFVYPNWRAVAECWDGVHMSARGVVATQGLVFKHQDSVIPPTNWVVESTLWLRWGFDSIRPEGEIE